MVINLYLCIYTVRLKVTKLLIIPVNTIEYFMLGICMTDCTTIITNRNQTRYSFRSIYLITNPVYNKINIFELRQLKRFLYTYIKVRL